MPNIDQPVIQNWELLCIGPIGPGPFWNVPLWNASLCVKVSIHKVALCAHLLSYLISPVSSSSTGSSHRVRVSFYLHQMQNVWPLIGQWSHPGPLIGQNVWCLGAHRKHFLNSLLKGFMGFLLATTNLVVNADRQVAVSSKSRRSGILTLTNPSKRRVYVTLDKVLTLESV